MPERMSRSYAEERAHFLRCVEEMSATLVETFARPRAPGFREGCELFVLKDVRSEKQAAVELGPLIIDLAFRRVLLDGVEVGLTRKEYAVLAQLASHPGRVITQQQLLKDIWGPSHVENSHYLRIVIGHLRQKLADDPTSPRFIATEAGVGYRLLS